MTPRREGRVFRLWLICAMLMLLSNTAAAMHWYEHHGARSGRTGESGRAVVVDCEICIASTGTAAAPPPADRPATPPELALRAAAPVSRALFHSTPALPYASRAPPFIDAF